METKDEVIEILNDLIRINIDRSEGYERAASAIRDSMDAEIKSLFFKMAEDSRNYKNDLLDCVVSMGQEPVQDSTVSGKIYRAWMDLKVSFSGDEIKTALESCEHGEDAALKAYQDALQKDLSWPAEVLSVVSKQRQELRSSHDKIKRYRDEYKMANHLKST